MHGHWDKKKHVPVRPPRSVSLAPELHGHSRWPPAECEEGPPSLPYLADFLGLNGAGRRVRGPRQGVGVLLRPCMISCLGSAWRCVVFAVASSALAPGAWERTPCARRREVLRTLAVCLRLANQDHVNGGLTAGNGAPGRVRFPWLPLGCGAAWTGDVTDRDAVF